MLVRILETLLKITCNGQTPLSQINRITKTCNNTSFDPGKVYHQKLGRVIELMVKWLSNLEKTAQKTRTAGVFLRFAIYASEFQRYQNFLHRHLKEVFGLYYQR